MAFWYLPTIHVRCRRHQPIVLRNYLRYSKRILSRFLCDSLGCRHSRNKVIIRTYDQCPPKCTIYLGGFIRMRHPVISPRALVASWPWRRTPPIPDQHKLREEGGLNVPDPCRESSFERTLSYESATRKAEIERGGVRPSEALRRNA